MIGTRILKIDLEIAEIFEVKVGTRHLEIDILLLHRVKNKVKTDLWDTLYYIFQVSNPESTIDLKTLTLLYIAKYDSYLRVPDVVHAELQLVPVLAGPGQRGVDQPAEQILPVHYHVEVELLPATRLS